MTLQSGCVTTCQGLQGCGGAHFQNGICTLGHVHGEKQKYWEREGTIEVTVKSGESLGFRVLDRMLLLARIDCDLFF